MKPTDFTEHPEGGRFQEVFRSNAVVTRAGGDSRAALTHIFFSLDPGEVSRFHKVESDEIWNLYRGDGLRLVTWDGTDNPPETVILSADSGHYCHVVPAGTWQAAEPVSDTVLAGCSVAPGFEFEDFQLMEPASETAEQLRGIDGTLSRYIDP